jgi:hypothetical protein
VARKLRYCGEGIQFIMLCSFSYVPEFHELFSFNNKLISVKNAFNLATASNSQEANVWARQNTTFASSLRKCRSKVSQSTKAEINE